MKKPDNIWHPFTQMKTDTNTLLITKTKGVSLFDDLGNLNKMFEVNLFS